MPWPVRVRRTGRAVQPRESTPSTFVVFDDLAMRTRMESIPIAVRPDREAGLATRLLGWPATPYRDPK